MEVKTKQEVDKKKETLRAPFKWFGGKGHDEQKTCPKNRRPIQLEGVKHG